MKRGRMAGYGGGDVTRGWLLGSLVIAGALVGAVGACYDSPAPTERVEAGSRAAENRVHAPNRMAFVGELHNALMDDYRKSLRRGARTFAVPCRGVMAWFKSAPAAAHLRQGLSAEQLEDLSIRAAIGTKSCREVADRLVRARRARTGTVAAWASAGDTISDAAVGLLSQIQSLTATVTSAASLDDSLDPIIVSAGSLDSISAEAVLSAAAVASSSAHYWEANYVESAVALLPVSEGGACEVDCLSGQWETHFTPEARSYYFRNVMFNPLSPTGQACLAELIASTGGWADIAKADLFGAIGAVVLEKKFDLRGFAIITGLASASQMSWHQLGLVACYVFAM